MEFTLKKFRLMGARARIKKIIQIVEKLVPILETPADFQILPTYLEYLITLNPPTGEFRFQDDELQQLASLRSQLSHWPAEDNVALRERLSSDERRQVAKVLLQLRTLLQAKIQAPIREVSLLVLERDQPLREPLVWPMEIVVVLDHLRSPYNVGAIVRTMECVGLNRLLGIGYTPRLDSRQVQRSAMGCEIGMQADYVPEGVAALKALQQQHYQVYILETITPSTSVFQLDAQALKAQNIAFVVGNEEFGVDESLIALADHVLHIPTFGVKNSLNVSIAFSIAIYQFWSVLLGEN